jgi:Mrp family chromosome partitioning ATPase
MARFLDRMKQAEDGQRQPPPEPRLDAPADPPFTLHVAPPPATDFADDEPPMPFIEVGPSRSVEGSADVLAYRPIVAALTTPVSDGPRSVTFRPLPGSVSTPTGFAAEVIAFHEPGHRVSGHYRELLREVLSATGGSAAPALLFTGSAAGAGTTTVVLNFAVTAARHGHRVVVIDANSRRPAVAARLALCDRPGLGEVLAATATLDEALQETKQSSLVALASGGPALTVPRGAESYRSLLRQLRQRFDLVLIDGPRWDGRPEVTAPGGACDAAFLVVPAGSEDTPATEQLLREIPGNGVHLAGSIVAAR